MTEKEALKIARHQASLPIWKRRFPDTLVRDACNSTGIAYLRENSAESAESFIHNFRRLRESYELEVERHFSELKDLLGEI